MITNTKHLRMSALYALVASLTAVALLFVGFFLAEPVIGHGQQEIFSIHQTITDETSFLVVPTDVTMVGSITGMTGGQATGTTQFVVQSNNLTGYVVNIAFTDDNADGEMMEGEIDDGGEIHDYGGDVAGQPSFNFTASTSAQFAYTVTSSATGDTDQSFLNNGTACNTGSTGAGGLHCWKAPNTTTFDIVNRSTAATTGATTTIQFSVQVPSGAIPVPTAQTYTATATLTLIIN